MSLESTEFTHSRSTELVLVTAVTAQSQPPTTLPAQPSSSSASHPLFQVISRDAKRLDAIDDLEDGSGDTATRRGSDIGGESFFRWKIEDTKKVYFIISVVEVI